MKNLFAILFITTACIVFASCQKVIHVDLNSSAPKLVVEGEVSDQTGPYTIHLSRSVNFDQSNTLPPASGATVAITDSTIGFTDTLTETSTPGFYTTHSLVGVQGHTYQLYIKDGSNEYRSSSTMPAKVPLDSLFVTNFDVFGKLLKQITPVYTDPGGVKNQYRFIEYVDGKKIDKIFVYDDKYTDGLVNNRPITNSDTDVVAGNTVRLEMQCIDEPVYKFLNTLDESALGESSTPGNPVNNITGGALGYFSAHTSESRTIIVP